MPRIRPLGASSGVELGGFLAPGLYASLLEHERARVDHHDPRWRYTAAAARGEEMPPKYRRSRHLLDALEAGKTVIVPLPHSKTWSLPWSRPEVTDVSVTPKDVVRPSDIRCAYPGMAIDDEERG